MISHYKERQNTSASCRKSTKPCMKPEIKQYKTAPYCSCVTSVHPSCLSLLAHTCVRILSPACHFNVTWVRHTIMIGLHGCDTLTERSARVVRTVLIRGNETLLPSSIKVTLSSSQRLTQRLGIHFWIFFLREVKMAEDIKTKLETYRTAPFDARFPNQNQTRNCWSNYLGKTGSRS